MSSKNKYGKILNYCCLLQKRENVKGLEPTGAYIVKKKEIFYSSLCKIWKKKHEDFGKKLRKLSSRRHFSDSLGGREKNFI